MVKTATSHIPRDPLEEPKEITTTRDDLLKKSNPVDGAKDLMDVTKDWCKRSHGNPDHDHHEGEKAKKQKTVGIASSAIQHTPTETSQQNPTTDASEQPKDVKIEDNHMDMDLDSGKDAWFDELLNSVTNLEEGEIPPNGSTIDFLRQMKEVSRTQKLS
ncbi:hypothetical protein Tco_0337307 [Tanacetum coccineum]